VAVCRLVVSLAIQRIQCHLSDMTNRTYAKAPSCPSGRPYLRTATLTRTDIPRRVIVCYRLNETFVSMERDGLG